MITVPIEKKAKKIGNTTVSGGGMAVSAKPAENTVAARDYTTSKGYSGIVDWDGENVVVGGKAVKPVYVRNGVAYADKSELDNAIGEFESRNGISGSGGVVKKYDEKYGEKLHDALDALTEREPFSYSPDTDPSYEAYSRRYKQLADEAYRRVLNDNNTSAAGASGAVLSDAIAARYAFIDELADIIPELEKNAYERYVNETQQLEDNLDGIRDIANDYYERIYQSNRDAVSDAVKAGAAEREEKQRWTDNERDMRKDSLDEAAAMRDAALDTAELDRLALELLYYPYETELELEGKRIDNESDVLDNALSRGFFIESDEKYLPWLAGYRTGSGYSINPHTAAAALEYSKAHSRQRAVINAKMGR